MTGSRSLLLTIAGLFGASFAVAQPGSFGPICAGLKSIAWCHQFDTGLPTAMAVGANGNTYVGSASTVTALGPDGSVLYKAQFQSPINFIASGGGTLWVLAGSLFQVDGQGNESPIADAYGGAAVSSDTLGSLYLAGFTSSNYAAIVKLNTAGAVVGVFSLEAYGNSTAITVDSSGAVYVVGTAVAGFPATTGAYQTTVPVSAYGVSEGYLLKIAPALDHVVYATLLYQGQPVEDITSPAAVAVDSLGNAYLGGYFYPAPDQPFPASQIGLPVQNQSGSAYLLKLNPQGSALVWSDGLGSSTLDSLAVLPNGQIRALVAVQDASDEAMFAVDSGNGALESAYFLGGVTSASQPGQPNGFLAAPSSGSAPPRVLVAVNSGRIPVIFNDQAATPVLMDFVDPPPTADLSLSLSLVQPLVTGNGTVDVVATVQNNGPADAEGVQVQVGVGDPDNTGTPLLECFPGGVAICNTRNGVLIPSLPAGTAMNVEFVYHYFCGSLTCTQWVDGSLYALTSDTNLANNFASIALPFTTGFDALLVPPQASLLYYRSDSPIFAGGANNPPPTADSSLTVWVPAQTYAGNMWYFDSWADGNSDNPRVFDAADGIPVSQGEMNFHTALPFGVDPGSLDLVALYPGSPPAAQVTLYPVNRPGIWTIGTPAASWLTLSARGSAADDGSEVVTGTANVTGLAPGYYTTTFPAKLAVSGLPDANLDVPVSLRILASSPAILPGGVVNAASYQGGPLSSLEIIAIYGSGLGPPQLVSASVPQAGSLPTTLAGTSVEIQGQPAELLYVQDNAVAAIVPNVIYEVPATVTVKVGAAQASLTMPASSGPGINSTALTPALFTSNSSGSGNLAAVNADGTINSALQPAKRGSVVLLYGTGFFEFSGLTCVGIGRNFGSLLLDSTPPVEAFVGGEPAYVLYSGSAPGMTCAAQQFDVVIPEDSATGPAVPVQLGIPFPGEFPTDPYVWYTTQSGTTLAIQ